MIISNDRKLDLLKQELNKSKQEMLNFKAQ